MARSCRRSGVAAGAGDCAGTMAGVAPVGVATGAAPTGKASAVSNATSGPIAAAARRLLQQELARMQVRPGYRSTPEILRHLAAGHMVYEPRAGSAAGAGAQRVWLPWLPAMGLALPLMPEEVAAEQARRRYGAAGLGRWSAPERMAWRRMAPVLMALPGVERWSPQQRSAAVAAVRAKGGAHELAYLQQVNQHAALCKGLQALARAVAAKQGKF